MFCPAAIAVRHDDKREGLPSDRLCVGDGYASFRNIQRLLAGQCTTVLVKRSGGRVISNGRIPEANAYGTIADSQIMHARTDAKSTDYCQFRHFG
jgi:hypothetical protein